MPRLEEFCSGKDCYLDYFYEMQMQERPEAHSISNRTLFGPYKFALGSATQFHSRSLKGLFQS
jgi:hypothetical protein